MKTNKILVLLIISILILQPLITSVQAINRYAEIEYGDKNYITITRDRNETSKERCVFRYDIDLKTEELIDCSGVTSPTATANHAPTPSYEQNFIRGSLSIVNHHTLNPTDFSTARFNPTDCTAPCNVQISDIILGSTVNSQLRYNPISDTYTWGGTRSHPDSSSDYQRHIYTSTGRHILTTDNLANNLNARTLYNTRTGLTTYLGISDSTAAKRIFNTQYEDLRVTENYTLTNLPGTQSSAPIALFAIDEYTTALLPVHYYHASRDDYNYNQYQLTSTGYNLLRTVNIGADYRIRGMNVLHNNNNRLIITGHYVDGADYFGFYKVYGTGLLITESMFSANSTIRNPTQLADGTIMWILDIPDSNRSFIEFRDPVTFGLKSSSEYPRLEYEDIEVYGASARRFNDKGFNPSLRHDLTIRNDYSSQNLGSNRISYFDAVPKDVYHFLYDGTKNANWSYTDIDLTNRRVAVTISDAGNIDNLPISMLVTDGRSDTNELYGYNVLEDMQFVESVNTGLQGGAGKDATHYNFSNILSSNRFYILDVNITNTRTSTNNISQVGFILGDSAFTDFSTSANSIQTIIERQYAGAGSILGNHAGLKVDERFDLQLLGYSSTGANDLNYLNIKVYVDTFNNMYSHKLTSYYDTEPPKINGFTHWKSFGSQTLRGFSLITDVNTEGQVIIDVYRRNSIPSMTARIADSTFSNAKVLPIQILREGTNTIEIAYTPSGTGQHANNVVWEYDVTMINGAILGIPSTILPQPSDPDSGVGQGSPLFGGLLPDFMSTTQQSAMFYAFAIIILVMIITFLIGHGAGYPLIGGIGSMAFMFMLIFYFSLVGWLPLWIPVLGFIIASLLGAGMVRRALVGGSE